MNTLLILLISLFLAGVAEAQITCFQAGGMVSCSGPNGMHSLQQELAPGQGVISGQRQYGAPSYMEPYTVLPPPSTLNPFSVAPPAFPQMPAFNQPAQPSTPMFLPGLEPLGTYTPYSFGSAPGQ